VRSRVGGPYERSLSNLVNEILLRLAKAGAAAILGFVVYLVLVGPLGATGSAELALLSWLSGAAFILLVETGPL
jgi:hypothetical protein